MISIAAVVSVVAVEQMDSVDERKRDRKAIWKEMRLYRQFG